MPRVFIPSALKSITGGVGFVDLDARTVRGVVEQLDAAFPGIASRLQDGDSLKSGLAVSIDGQIATLGLFQKVETAREVHFVLAIGGG